MLKIEKLSEKNLYEVIAILFAKYSNLIESQKHIKTPNKRFIVDYYLKTDTDQFIFEFDGPTHFCNTATQYRDRMLAEYCEVNNIQLIRFPYFIQPTIEYLIFIFDDAYNKYNMESADIQVEYKNGFYDKKIVLPGDFNNFGWKLFFKIYYCGPMKAECSLVSKQIFESLCGINPEISLGLDYSYNEEKQIFFENYPT